MLLVLPVFTELVLPGVSLPLPVDSVMVAKTRVFISVCPSMDASVPWSPCRLRLLLGLMLCEELVPGSGIVSASELGRVGVSSVAGPAAVGFTECNSGTTGGAAGMIPFPPLPALPSLPWLPILGVRLIPSVAVGLLIDAVCLSPPLPELVILIASSSVLTESNNTFDN